MAVGVRASVCPSCGTDLSREQESTGLCPSCLIQLALDDTSAEVEFLIESGEAPTLQFSAKGFSEGEIQGERYRIRSLLGRGGMGEVWRAYDLKLRQDVALKALRPELIANKQALETLRQEVRVAREVISPNVCRVFDLQEVDGQELVSMEYVDGTTLQEVLKERSPLGLNEAREIASQFLAGLEAIHEAGLVHRDIKPENLMITCTGRVVVMDFGIAKGLGDGKSGLIAGTPAYMSPEQARGVEIDARADLFAAGVVLAEMVEPGGISSFEDRQRVWEGIHQEEQQITDTPWSKVIARAVSAETQDRFESASALARALEEVTLRAAGEETARPYPGLSAFQQEDAEYFYGRELEAEALWKKLRRPHLLAVMGPSGAGKSSFLRAGLLPTLTDGWQAVIATPGNRPFANLARALAEELPEDRSTIDALLRFEEPEVALDLITQWQTERKHGLIILDQFEELFTQNPDSIQQAFAELLGLVPLEADVFVLLSMRDDFLFYCQAFESLKPVFSEMTPLGPPTGASLRRAIVEPALKCGYRFEDEAIVEEMLGEVEGQRGALPLLAFAAAQLWERRDRDSGLLTRKAYEQIGGVSGSLAQHAEAMLEYIGEANVPIVRELFRNLVTAQGTRASRERGELLSVFPETEGESFLEPSEVRLTPVSKPQRPAARHVLNSLVDARLLTSYEIPADAEDGEPLHQVEIVHESLLARWPRLVRWQRQDADSAQMRDELRAQAKIWDEHDRSEDYLWTGTAFKEYALWRESYPGGLTEVEEAFGAAMVHLAERQKRRRRTAITTAFGVLLVVLGVVARFGWQAEQERRRAEGSKLLALAQLRLEEDPTEALAYVVTSLELSDTEKARHLALRVLQESPPALEADLGDLSGGSQWFSPDGTWLATAGATDKVRVWHAEGGQPIVLPGQEVEGGKLSVWAGWAASDLIITGQWMGEKVDIWRMPTGERLRTIEFDTPTFWQAGRNQLLTETVETEADTGHEIYQLNSWTLPDGEARDLGRIDSTGLGASWSFFDYGGSRWIYNHGSEIFTRSLPLRPGDQAQLVGSHENDVLWAVIPNEADRLWSRDASTGELCLWDLRPPETRPLQRIVPPRIPGPPTSFFPDLKGRWVRASSRDGQSPRAWGVDAWRDARPLEFRRAGSSFASRAEFHPEGNWLVVGTHGRTRLTMWPLPEARPWVVDGYSNSYVRPVVFSSDGRWLATAWPDGSVRLWPLPDNGTRDVLTLELPSETEGSVWPYLEFDAKNRFLFVVAYSRAACVVPLDGTSPSCLEGLPDANSNLSDGAVSPSGRLVATAFRNGPWGKGERSLWVWNLETQEMQQFDLPESSSSDPNWENGVWDLVFDGESTLYTSGDGGIRRWNLETGSHEQVVAPRAGSTQIWAAFGPRARQALLMEPLPGEETLGPAKVVDLATGRVREFLALQETPLQNPDLWPRNAFFSSGVVAAVGDPEGVVRVVRLAEDEPHLLLGHKGSVDSLAVSPDSRWIASTGEDNTLRLWPMPDLDKPPLHTLPHDELIAKLRSLTNIRVVRDLEASDGWKATLDPFPGWEEVPEW